MNEAQEIIPNLFLGNLDSLYVWMNEYNMMHPRSPITGIVSCLTKQEFSLERFMSTAPNRASINYMQIDIDDAEDVNIKEYAEEFCDFLRDHHDVYNEQKKVLVHCAMGISRSATFVIAYLMSDFGFALNAALRHVRSKRRIVNPNLGFMRQLQDFTDRLST